MLKAVLIFLFLFWFCCDQCVQFVYFGFFFRFDLPYGKVFEDSTSVEAFRKCKKIEAVGLYRKVKVLGKAILGIFPQSRVVYLGCGRTWFWGPRAGNIVCAENRRACEWWSGLTERERKNERLKEDNFRRMWNAGPYPVSALWSYRRLRNRFLREFKRDFVPEFSVGDSNLSSTFFFNNVFKCLRECHIRDKFGHLTFEGLRFVGKRFEELYVNS